MNVIISNKYAAMLQQLNIEVIKAEQGVFTVDELVSKYQNFFFQRMILDITAIKDYQDIKTLQKLSISLDMDKIILVLDDTDESSSSEYLSRLISIGIYNFTKNAEGIMYLYNNPNTYRDVAQYHQIDHENEPEMVVQAYDESRGVRIIGFKSVTPEAGATSLVYMIKRQLEKHYRVLAIEVDNSNFTFFMDKSLVSTTSENLANVIAKNKDKDIILIDMNNSAVASSVVHDIIYLLEPSTIKLNKMMASNPGALEGLKDKHVVLNKSLLTSKDVLDFEYESKLKIFYNLPPLDEREKNIHILNAFLVKLGFVKQQSGETEKKNKLLGLFGF